MANEPAETGTPARSRRKSVIGAVALFPLLVSAGVMTPGLVELAFRTDGAGDELAPRRAVESVLERQPLPAPRDPAVVFAPAALDLDQAVVVAQVRRADPASDLGGIPLPSVGAPATAAEIAQLLSFPRHDTDPIVLDELAPPEQQIVFKDALIPEELPELALVDQSELFLPLCFTIPSQDCIRFNDFTTVVPSLPIPEPGTGALVAAGLALLAIRRRRASLAAPDRTTL